MIGILVGIGIILVALIILYILGIIPNLWSREIIHPMSIGDVIGRGIKSIFYMLMIAVIVLLLWTLGNFILAII